MAKIDERIEILPDIEMYGGNNDKWVVRLYQPNGQRYQYADLATKHCVMTLVIKEFGYVHRSASSAFTLTKNGTLELDDDGFSAIAVFTLETGDTLNSWGKFTYQIEMTCAGTKQAAQGNLFIIKNINQ